MKKHSPKASVEVFHLLFLDLLGRKTDRKHYALKGGCNLRFFMKNIRYSEDMDIDVGPDMTKDKLQDVVDHIVGSKVFTDLLQARELQIAESSAPKQTDTTQRWKFGLSLQGSPLLLRTKIEFSRRGMVDETAFTPVDPQIIHAYELTPFLSNHYVSHAALEQKIRALATRREVQARDVFDIDLILNSGITPEEPDTSVYALAQENALSVTFDIFKAQVLSYLDAAYQAQYDSQDVWESLVLRVVEALRVDP